MEKLAQLFQDVVQLWDKYHVMYLNGIKNTLILALVATVIGCLIGLVCGVLNTIPYTKNDPWPKRFLLKLLRVIIRIYVEVFRGTPMVLQAVFVYYGLPYFTDNAVKFTSMWTAAILIVSINTGAYMSEIVRGGIDSIDKGQFEAAHAIGMTHWQTMVNVIIPQTVRNILPATSNEFVINIKDTSVLNVIAVSELYYVSKDIKGTLFRTFEVFFVTCVIYFIMTFTITRILRFIERKLDGPSSYVIHQSSTMPNTEFVAKRRTENE